MQAESGATGAQDAKGLILPAAVTTCLAGEGAFEVGLCRLSRSSPSQAAMARWVRSSLSSPWASVSSRLRLP